ncbi:adenylate/guanylate cyclase domain-containing protein [Kibdelosporangium philippinense]|uniref:Adenylate/guanylate cyclase domain-containing protein n=1 Tax=Kibdelosporangium philippinense TaxID=211113 RepID=A0ABS8ZJM0_9PSEU|nr:adenylate/guanylate cyclase domain-containing protein [Kibdelosporangium philippinense]MCE7008010.1 adenylate/guanylate cyclase domain-containing protein [Kibdelosporangium philippinense]
MSESLQARIERVLLGGRRKYTRHEVAAKAGVPLERATELWRSLGFASVGDDEVVFTENDVEALRMVQELADLGLYSESVQNSIARVLGQHVSRIAEMEIHVLRELVATQPALLEDERGFARFIDQLIPDLERLHNFTWRRQLAAYAGRALAAPEEPLEEGSQAVGFADMVGYTSLTRRSSETELASVLERFETTVTEAIAEHHGRVVKMLGDEVLFVADTPQAGADIALTLVSLAEEDSELPSLRAGLAYGRVLSRFGDVYGSTVNIASRLTSICRPGAVLIDSEMAAALADNSAFSIRQRRPVSVRGFHRLKPSVLRRA